MVIHWSTTSNKSGLLCCRREICYKVYIQCSWWFEMVLWGFYVSWILSFPKDRVYIICLIFSMNGRLKKGFSKVMNIFFSSAFIQTFKMMNKKWVGLIFACLFCETIIALWISGVSSRPLEGKVGLGKVGVRVAAMHGQLKRFSGWMGGGGGESRTVPGTVQITLDVRFGPGNERNLVRLLREWNSGKMYERKKSNSGHFC